MNKSKNEQDIQQHISPMWAIIVRGGLSLLVIIMWILGVVGILEFALAIAISLMLLGAICIWTAFPMFKFGKKIPAIVTAIGGAVVIFCGIKTILGL